MSTITLPTIGQKVYPLPNDSGDWLGIPAEYHNKIGTVVSANMNGTLMNVVAEFQSHQKPDDSIRWHFQNWKPADDEPITFATRQRMIGKTIKVIYSGSSAVKVGEIHTVTDVFDYPEGHNGPTVADITVGVTVDGRERQWVQAYEVIEDGQTLTVSNVPAVGDYVRMTARLNAFGIEHGEWYGTVSKIDGSLILVNVDGLDHATGPESVEAAEKPEEVKPSEETGIITDLQQQVQRLTQARDTALQQARMWAQDFTTYADAILQEANDRNWCDEYDSVMERIQSRLQIAEIPDREEEFEVEVEVTGSVSTTTTVTVMARSQDDADEMVSNDINNYVDADEVLRDHIRWNGFDSTEVDTV